MSTSISINENLSEFYVTGENTIDVVGIIRSNIGIRLLKYDNIRKESAFSYTKNTISNIDIMNMYKLAQSLIKTFVK
jgi:hypothetical protein